MDQAPEEFGEAERAVAVAMYVASGDGTDSVATLDLLSEDDRFALLEMARVAMTTHLDWMQANGFRIAPPGTMLRPKTQDDAKAMILAGQEFLAAGKGRSSSKSKLVGSPGLILPRGTQH
jgi:hypothetical protein